MNCTSPWGVKIGDTVTVGTERPLAFTDFPHFRLATSISSKKERRHYG